MAERTRVEEAIAALRAPPPRPLPNPLVEVPPPDPVLGREPCPECHARREFCSWHCAARVTEEVVDDFPLLLRVQRRITEQRLRLAPFARRLVEVFEAVDVPGAEHAQGPAAGEDGRFPPGAWIKAPAVRAHHLALMGLVRVVEAVE